MVKTPTIAQAATVARDLTLEGPSRRGALAAIGVDPIAGTTDRLEGLAPEGGIDPAAEMTDVHLDDVGVAVEALVPDVLDDLRLRAHVAPLAHQILQQRELAGGQRGLAVPPPAAVGGRGEAGEPRAVVLRA